MVFGFPVIFNLLQYSGAFCRTSRPSLDSEWHGLNGIDQFINLVIGYAFAFSDLQVVVHLPTVIILALGDAGRAKEPALP